MDCALARLGQADRHEVIDRVLGECAATGRGLDEATTQARAPMRLRRKEVDSRVAADVGIVEKYSADHAAEHVADLIAAVPRTEAA
eukprot:8672523-Pyramimonas_sp.AAC.1